MSKLLVVETSPRGDSSISRQMTMRFVSEWKAAHPSGSVTIRDLAETDLPFVTAPWLHAYFTQAMNAMYARLKNGTALPASQVVRTTPRGGLPGAAPAIAAGNVPGISAAPAAGDQIGFVGTSVNVPE